MKKIFSFRCRPPTVRILLESLPRFSTVIYPDNPVPPSHLVLVSRHYVYVRVSCVAAVVMIGKGTARQALTQIGDLVGIGNRIQTNQTASAGTRKAMVTIGKADPDQTKITNGSSSASEDPGRDW
jgi:hypothetical protein